MTRLLKLRIDVDYPYPSRIRSFIYTALGIKIGNDYLKNSKIIAKMINESTSEVKAHWFFTPKTIPDKELIDLLNSDKHEMALHIVNDPYEELKTLEKTTGRKVNYYTMHGTARLLARVMWKRWKTKEPEIPSTLPLSSFHQYPTFGLDVVGHICTAEETVNKANIDLEKGYVVYFHPIWLFQRGKLNRRGPFYEAFRRILDVDKEMENVSVRKKLFFKIARDINEYARDIIPTGDFLEKLGATGVDIFTFIERNWCNTIFNPPRFWFKAEDNIALLKVTTYDEWWKNVGKKTRNMVRKAEKNGVKIEVTAPSAKLADGTWKIYNETPIRQDRAFPHYGVSAQNVSRSLFSAKNSTFIGAFLKDELAGFIQLDHGHEITIISQILSLQKHSDKAVNNALIARAVKVCANKKSGWLMYGRMGNHPSLDRFKQSNGFTRFPLSRYYIPITNRGRIAIKIGLHREIKDALPQSINHRLIPLHNWISRNEMRIKLRLHP